MREGAFHVIPRGQFQIQSAPTSVWVSTVWHALSFFPLLRRGGACYKAAPSSPYTWFCFSSINKGRNIHFNGLWDQMFDGFFFYWFFFLTGKCKVD